MPTYLIKSEITITRQEGDVADVTITVPSVLDMTNRTPRFQVRDAAGKRLIDKTVPDVVVTEQVIFVPLLPADTAGKPGKHRWELEVTDTNGPVTIGRGDFNVVKQLIV